MKYQENYLCSKEESITQLKQIFTQVLKDSLEIEGNKIELPNDKDLEVKVKFDEDCCESKLTIKIQWQEECCCEDEDEEDEAEDKDEL
ncbi:hypothetical protein PV797_11445 [Clostridiaceae bacterium M8S5]|nr:hypothetical protein PV797_11445 [Clostridiaceae bacterium M8S5]